jgi:hypothetical protein
MNAAPPPQLYGECAQERREERVFHLTNRVLAKKQGNTRRRDRHTLRPHVYKVQEALWYKAMRRVRAMREGND